MDEKEQVGVVWLREQIIGAMNRRGTGRHARAVAIDELLLKYDACVPFATEDQTAKALTPYVRACSLVLKRISEALEDFHIDKYSVGAACEEVLSDVVVGLEGDINGLLKGAPEEFDPEGNVHHQPPDDTPPAHESRYTDPPVPGSFGASDD